MQFSARALFLLLLFFSFKVFSQSLSVARILPAGEQVAQTDSINITFSQPMVALGEFQAVKNPPVTITPKVECQWIWISNSTLSCKLSESKPLSLATKYDVIVGAMTDLKGNVLAKKYAHSFTTVLPAIERTSLRRWFSPAFPMISVWLNVPVSAESLIRSLSFTQQGRPAIKVKVINRRIEEKRNLSTVTAQEIMTVAANDSLSKESSSYWLVIPEKELGLGLSTALHLGLGLKSSVGPLGSSESKDVVNFSTYADFSFEGLTCRDSDSDESQHLAVLDETKCESTREVKMLFTTPVSEESLKVSCTLQPLKDSQAQKTYWEEAFTDEVYGDFHVVPNQTSEVTLPAVYKARTTFTISCSKDLKDIFGRKLKAAVLAKFSTKPRSERLAFGASVGVIEKGVESDVPLYVTNIDKAQVKYTVLKSNKREGPLEVPLALQKVDDLSYATPLGLRHMLGGQSGAAHVEVTSPAKNSTHEWRGFFQVSPFFVHFKEGHFNSLIWVRDFATGKAIEGAEVSLMYAPYAQIHIPQRETALGKTGKDGSVLVPGYVTYDPLLDKRTYDFDGQQLMVLVRKGADLAVLPLNYDFTVYPRWSDFSDYSYANQEPEHGHVKVWGTSPQGVYKAGESIDFKIYIRGQDAFRLTPPPQGPYSLTVVDATGKEVYTKKNIKLNEFGTFSGSFATAKSAAVGWYKFYVYAGFMKNKQQQFYDENGAPLSEVSGLISHRVLVTDFTPAPFRPENEIDKAIYKVGDNLVISSKARLHSGGAFGDAKVRVHVQLNSSTFEPKNNLPAAQYSYQCGHTVYGGITLFEKEGKLSAQGDIEHNVHLEDKKVSCGKLVVTSDIADDRGKFYSAVKQAEYYETGRFVGLKRDKFFYSENENVDLHFLVVDMAEKILSGVPVKIDIAKRVVRKSRVKGAGNAYLEESVSSTEKIFSCNQESKEKGETCRFKPKEAGVYEITATVKDSQGKENINTDSIYVTGKSAVVWEESDQNVLKIIPDSSVPTVGKNARYLIQNPFPGAEALITIERYGIIKSWNQKFDSSTPVVEFPVTEDMLPGFHLSVVVYSPRVAQPLGDGNVDLGKPTFRMGYLKVLPKNPVKELKVDVKIGAKEYRPGSKVTVQLSTSAKNQKPLAKIEYAVAVLDEAVFDLIQGGDKYFDIYRGFYNLDPLDVANYSLLMQLIGRQKFEKKGANAGGDGSGLSMRNVFKYVAYWNPSLKVDSQGRGQFEFQAPDNLTGWKVLVIATDPADRMGLGFDSFVVNRPTEVRPVMPNVVVEGDSFSGAFSVMNRTDKVRSLRVAVKAAGDVPSEFLNKTILEKTISAQPFKREIVSFPVKAPWLKEDRLVSGGGARFEIVAGDDFDKDSTQVTIPINKRRSFITDGTYGTFTEGIAKEKVKFPKDVYSDVGHVSVKVSATVIGNIQSAFEYMRQYPYQCWEQKLTKAVMASSFRSLQSYLNDSLKWPEAKALPQQILSEASSFQAPNGGMAYYNGQDSLVSPYLSAYTSLAMSWLKSRGEQPSTVVLEKLNKYLLNLLRTKVNPEFYSKGMAATVRAVSLAALAKNNVLPSAEIERYRAHVKDMDLFGKALYLQAALHFSDREAVAKDVLKMILGAANETGGKFQFIETLGDQWGRIHSSDLRTQCAILSALSLAAAKPWAASSIGDIPFKMVRFVTQTRARGQLWENTQENMFCSEALIDYSRRYESVKPNLKISATLAGKSFGSAEIKDLKQREENFRRPLTTQDLGTQADIEIASKGSGRVYYFAGLTYAPREEFKSSRNSGFEVRREYFVERGGKFILLTSPLRLRQGELVRVNLYIMTPGARNFVVVHDPVPGGLEVLNQDLANTSAVDSAKAQAVMDKASFLWQFNDWQYFSMSYSGFYHREIRHDSVRFYSEYLEKGRYQLSYMAQVIAPGSFVALPTQVEEMYDADVYGKSPAAQLEVTP